MLGYWFAEMPVRIVQAQALADDLGVDVDAITGDDPLRSILERLGSPLYKADVVSRAQAHGVGLENS